MCFARPEHVAEMRKLLLDHRADETEDDRKQWVTRQRADLCESIRIREAKEDLQAYDPCGAAIDMEI